MASGGVTAVSATEKKVRRLLNHLFNAHHGFISLFPDVIKEQAADSQQALDKHPLQNKYVSLRIVGSDGTRPMWLLFL